MKKIIALSFVLATIGFSASAQQEKEERADRPKREHMEKHQKHFEELGLNESQKTQIQALNAEFKQKREALRNSSVTQEQRQTQRQALNAERKTKLKAILTAEQWNKMEEMKKDRKMEDGRMHRNKKGGMHKGSKGEYKKMKS
jgi:Spy/CpxP family protein refolding chaperone